MSVQAPGPGWWLASDGRYYPPPVPPGYQAHLSADGSSWWNGTQWVAMPSRRHRWVGVVAIILSVLTLGYCAPMSVIGIADSRGQPGYDPGLFEALYPLIVALPAIVFAVVAIVVDRHEGRGAILGWLSLAVVAIASLLLWFFIFAGA